MVWQQNEVPSVVGKKSRKRNAKMRNSSEVSAKDEHADACTAPDTWVSAVIITIAQHYQTSPYKASCDFIINIFVNCDLTFIFY